MKHEIVIPKLGLTMEEATLLAWHHEDGQRVAKGDTVITIETDKIVFDVEAEQEGFLQRVAAADARLPVGALAGYLHATAQGAKAADGGPAGASDPADQPTEFAISEAPAAAPASSALEAANPASHPAVLTAGTTLDGGRLMVSPVARSLAQARQIGLAGLTGSGPGGVILKRDVESAEQANQSNPARQGSQGSQGSAVKPADQVTQSARPTLPPGLPAGAPGTQRRPLTAMRRAISERMMKSLTTTAQMTGFGKVDMSEAVKLRGALVAVADYIGTRISYTDIIIKAAATVLAQMPGINSYIDGNDVVTWTDVNIGMAVSVEGGLMVPVIRNVDRLSLVRLSQLRLALIDKARAGKLTREDVEGGTFTVSNFGSYGGDFETPILNTPQSALLGVGKIEDEPVVRDGQIVIRPMMAISLTFDHRLIDGALAGEFRKRFKALLEAPAQATATSGAAA